MKGVLIFLLVLWLVLSVVGALAEGLLWLLFVGLLLLVLTALYGWFRARRRPNA